MQYALPVPLLVPNTVGNWWKVEVEFFQDTGTTW